MVNAVTCGCRGLLYESLWASTGITSALAALLRSLVHEKNISIGGADSASRGQGVTRVWGNGFHPVPALCM